jgi:hypothetical protein
MREQKNSLSIFKMEIALIVAIFCFEFIDEVNFQFYIFQKAKELYNVFLFVSYYHHLFELLILILIALFQFFDLIHFFLK